MKHKDIPYASEEKAAEAKAEAQEQPPKPFDLSSLEVPVIGTAAPRSSKIDFAALAIPQNFDLDQPVEELVTLVKVGRPNQQGYVRFKEDFAKTFFVINLKEERETYLVVNKELWSLPYVSRELKKKSFFLYTNRDRQYGLWEVATPGGSEKFSTWSSSAMNAVRAGREKWVRIITIMGSGYKAETSPGIVEQPKWPTISDEEILELAFNDRLIDSIDHPVLRKLRGLE
jgi:hypothetical protein